MSKFFRSGASDSSDSTESSDSESKPDDVVDGQLLNRGVTEGASPRNEIARAGPTTASNKDLLLHALLEERCRNEVRQDAKRRGLSLDESELTIQARAKYQSLSAELARLGIVDDEPAGQDRAPIREQILRGLDLLSQGSRSMPLHGHVGTVLPPLLIDGGPVIDEGRAKELLDLRYSPYAQVGLALHTHQATSSRYTHDFEEIDMIGRGGYGSVYACKHRLDNVIYAIKKIVLPSTTSQRPPLEVSSEADAMLNEVRMLARLDHPNIVRYHNGWIDWGLDASNHPGEPDATSGASDTRFTPGHSLGRIITKTDTDESHIAFENSSSGQLESMGDDREQIHPTTNIGQGNEIVTQSALQARSCDQTQGTESISRDMSAQSELSGTNGLVQRLSGPSLALHIQMALYPTNLAAFLTPPAQESQNLLCHCFHIRPSVRILLAILDGVDYLHRHNVVHRDLKPGNVFLEACTETYADGSVDLFDCPRCLQTSDTPTVGGAKQQHTATGAGLESQVGNVAMAPNAHPSIIEDEATAIRRLRIRIGDFGLATLRTSSATSINAFDVGTALYQPFAVPHPHSPQLDLYALGLIAFELVWPFATRMERHATLSAVKTGTFPPDFDAQMGDGGNMRNCITSMLTKSDVTLSEVRSKLQRILN
nr:hypothetical protein B0A51_14064 [Rachicladosporium sp. CCFEE 5018]